MAYPILLYLTNNPQLISHDSPSELEEVAAAGGRGVSPGTPRRGESPFALSKSPHRGRRIIAVGASPRNGIHPTQSPVRATETIKIMIFDCAVAYIGSANLTGAGIGMKGDNNRNFEAGILTDEPQLVDAAADHLDSVWQGTHCAKCRRKDFCGDRISR